MLDHFKQRDSGERSLFPGGTVESMSAYELRRPYSVMSAGRSDQPLCPNRPNRAQRRLRNRIPARFGLSEVEAELLPGRDETAAKVRRACRGFLFFRLLDRISCIHIREIEQYLSVLWNPFQYQTFSTCTVSFSIHSFPCFTPIPQYLYLNHDPHCIQPMPSAGCSSRFGE